MSCLPPSESPQPCHTLTGSLGRPPAWGTACFGEVHGLEHASSGPAGAKSLSCASSSKTPLTKSCKAGGRRDRVHKSPGSPFLQGCKAPQEACGLWASPPSSLLHTKICSEHQLPSNLPPASSAPLGRTKTLGSWAAMSVVGTGHLWKRGDSPSSWEGLVKKIPYLCVMSIFCPPSPAPGSQGAPQALLPIPAVSLP